MEGQARRRLSGRAQTLGLVGFIIGHGGVTLPHYRCKIFMLQCSFGRFATRKQPSFVGFLGSRARRTIRLHLARRIRHLEDENFFVLLRFYLLFCRCSGFSD
ncbi:hypothetical protein BJX64DRAFT_256413 [Aspergillus heterothallicus]